MSKKKKKSKKKPIGVLVEMRVQPGATGMFAMRTAGEMKAGGFKLDQGYAPVKMGGPRASSGSMSGREAQTYLVRGEIEEDKISELEKDPNVVKVWIDTKIAPFSSPGKALVSPMSPTGTCPIPPCDCSPGTPKGTIADVVNYLGVDQIWSEGYNGTGMVIGIVDGGITAQGRPISTADTSAPGWTGQLIPRVTNGWPAADWGTTGVDWGWHGNMTGTDALGMAPDANLYDLRISSGTISGTISNAIAAFQWAIDQHVLSGTPHILSNSWGIFQESWDSTYANDANHPFTRKVEDALDEGILVLFAAGNCGDVCPDGRCGSDSGPGKSIWGANGHPRVMTVAAVNKNEQYIGYSSMGPASLDPNKPDFCGISHFTGFFNSDSGTSAACPVVAGVVALLKEAKPNATQDQIKKCLKDTAKDIGPTGWDQYAGAGIIRAKVALNCLKGPYIKCPPAPIFKCPPAPYFKCPPAPYIKCPPAPLFCPPAPYIKCPPAPYIKCPPAPYIKCPPAPEQIYCPPAPEQIYCPPAPEQIQCPPAPDQGCPAGPYKREIPRWQPRGYYGGVEAEYGQYYYPYASGYYGWDPYSAGGYYDPYGTADYYSAAAGYGYDPYSYSAAYGDYPYYSGQYGNEPAAGGINQPTETFDPTYKG